MKIKKLLIITLFAGMTITTLSGQTILLPDSCIVTDIRNNPIRKQTFVYDNYGNEISNVSYMRNNATGSWNEYFRTEYEWDSKSNQIKNAMYQLDTITQKWEGIAKQMVEYNDSDNEITRIYYEWDDETGNWKFNAKKQLEYDNDGQPTASKFYGWNDETGDWGFFEQNDEYDLVTLYDYEYDTSGNILSTIIDDDDDGTGNYKYGYEYDASGNQILETFYRWDTDKDNWMHYYQYGYDYDEHNWLTARSCYSWNAERSDWKGLYLYKYEHDKDGNPQKINLYDWIDNEWQQTEIAAYYYSNRSAAVAPISGTIAASIYPNPIGDYVTIAGAQGANINITTSEGRTVLLKKNVEVSETIYASSWTAGIYLISIQLNGNQLTKKMIKK